MCSYMTDLFVCRVIFKGSQGIIHDLLAKMTEETLQFCFSIWINNNLAHLKFLLLKDVESCNLCAYAEDKGITLMVEKMHQRGGSEFVKDIPPVVDG